MRIIHTVVKRLASTREKHLLQFLKPVVLILAVLLLLFEALSLIVMPSRWFLLELTFIYWFVFAAELLLIGFFFFIYGYRIRGLLMNSASKDLEAKASSVKLRDCF